MSKSTESRTQGATAVLSAASMRRRFSRAQGQYVPAPQDSEGQPQPACAGLDRELFFPKPTRLTSAPSAPERSALAVCAACPARIRSACLRMDLAQDDVTSINGIFGGLREEARRQLHRRQRAAGAEASA
ncbi:WhiB family transcriptional regulator [Streptomyces sp. NPDC006879]|uniref:WhiB family transcriptional regulator n=1 Tax=Streptomyces sp. NPDC006879 TaxID=3364767 RepID=UPI0036B16E46